MATKAAKKKLPVVKKVAAKKAVKKIDLPLKESKFCPVGLLDLDLNNPRLETGIDLETGTEDEVIETLYDIAALDELITSICSNQYQNLEPLIVISKPNGHFRVIEGNRRLAAIKLIRSPDLAKRLQIRVPKEIPRSVIKSTDEILVWRVAHEDDARAFIGFKHINGPQRWDAYAKARYVTEWYKKAKGTIGIDEIAAKMGDNNNTLRSYIYSILILDQAEDQKIWTIKDRSTPGRFAFSHFYTALGRKEYQDFLGIAEEGWSDTPPIVIIPKDRVDALRETLTYIYGSKSDDRPALVRSQNPDLKDVGMALVNDSARAVLRNRGDLDAARDELKSASEAFVDALVAANLRLKRAVDLLPKYPGGNERVDAIATEIFEQADTLVTMTQRKTKRSHNAN